ncbi:MULTISPECIES: FkbM family methyltransferase [unclassified Pseudomonas]|uniref:FkbM family methyltransferase n=1 Tax=unclassified Pseudomonas TaxID=196821 RepID=UPI0015A1D320|nr:MULTISPECIES: FkbM family methyltransferase [unclassified Pseudomonas]NWC92353.1 FkbM family methyltransferase [Pseudomonas sp. IPO3779]NWD19865.1 FkbM family methyltransferase [Pseudomonas sp. IPO3778]
MTNISETIDALFERSSRELADKIAFFDSNDFYLYGSGNMGRAVLALFRKVGCEPRGFIDDTPAKQGTVIDGLPVVSAPVSASSSIVVCIHNPHHNYQNTLDRFGEKTLSFMHIPWLFPELSIAHAAHPNSYRQYRNDIIAVYEALADETSRRTFLEQLAFRLTLEWNFSEFTEPPYFPNDIGLPFDSPVNFIDAGAYDGDTVKLFLQHFPRPGKIVAVEADPTNYAKLKEYMDGLDIEQSSHHAAMDGVEGVLKFDATGDMAARLSEKGQITVNSYTLEHFMKEVGDPCYVKFDVEGAESSIIEHSQDLLRDRKPILAVSVYHHAPDMIEIPLSLHRLGYRITLRYHGIDGADLVLYGTAA